MDNEKFAVIFPILIGALVNKIILESGDSEDIVFEKFYNSGLYAQLENEPTKVWTYSVPLLYKLYTNEMATGILELPEY